MWKIYRIFAWFFLHKNFLNAKFFMNFSLVAKFLLNFLPVARRDNLWKMGNRARNLFKDLMQISRKNSVFVFYQLANSRSISCFPITNACRKFCTIPSILLHFRWLNAKICDRKAKIERPISSWWNINNEFLSFFIQIFLALFPKLSRLAWRFSKSWF
jgi:hypothetical protein